MSKFQGQKIEIPMTVAGLQTINLQGDRFKFLHAVNASGVIDVDAKIEVSMGAAGDEWMPMYADSEIEGFSDRWKVRWVAHSGLTAIIVISRAGYRVSAPPTKQLVTSSIGTQLSSAAVTVGTSAVVVAAASSSRQSVVIQNKGSVPIYLGGSAVTTATGIEVAAGAAFTIDKTTAAVYAISGSAGQDVRVMIED